MALPRRGVGSRYATFGSRAQPAAPAPAGKNACPGMMRRECRMGLNSTKKS